MLRRPPLAAIVLALMLLIAPTWAQQGAPPMVPSGGGGGGITVGSPFVGCGTPGGVAYNNSGLIGCEVVSGTGTVTSVGWTGGIVSIANPTTVPAFTIAGTSGGIPYFASSSTWASSAALAANAIVIGGGAGAAPSTTTTGANVLTALGAAINASTGLPNVDGAITTGDCLKWGPGIQDAGSACGSGGGGTLTVGSTATSGGAAGQLMYDTGSVLTESANLTFTTGLLINGATLPTNAAFAANYSPGANTATPGFAIINANLASSGNQQEACDQLSGQGWATTPVASQPVLLQLCVVPVQGAANPTPAFTLAYQVNGGTKTSIVDFGITKAGDTTFLTETQVKGANLYSISGTTAVNAIVWTDGAGPQLATNSTGIIGFGSGSGWSGSLDTAFSRISAGVVGLGAGGRSSHTVDGTLEGGNLIETAAASTVAASQIGYGGTVAAASNCNVTSPTPTGCVVINVAGTTRYLPYY